jgi:hypothetical protein
MLYYIVEENYLNKRDMFQESVTTHSLKHLALSGVSISHLRRSYDRHICITEMGN